MVKTKIILLNVILASLVLTSCSSVDEKPQEESVEVEQANDNRSGAGQASVAAVEGEDMNTLQLALSMDDFSTLVAAVKAAGVEDALVNAGPLTTFAPVNGAFVKIQSAVDNLLKPENKKTLALVLTNHVAPSNYPIRQLKKEAKKGRKLYMASGKYLTVENKDGKIFVGGTEILQSVKVSNGWVHVIGDVLVPSED